jgi:hypothetical protein
VILLLNGAFGIGKTTVARALVTRMPGSVLFDPEMIGIPLQRVARAVGRTVEDFQDLRTWRSLAVLGLRLARARWATMLRGAPRCGLCDPRRCGEQNAGRACGGSDPIRTS